MEYLLERAIGYSQYVGALINEAEFEYAKHFEKCLNDLQGMEDETETTRKAKLGSWTAELKRNLSNLKTMNSGLRAIKMSLMQAIKTRREEPINHSCA